MRLIKVLLLVFLGVSIYGNAQIIEGEKFTIEIKKTKINKLLVSTSMSDISLPKDVERLQVRIRIHSKSKKREFFNPNAFSIVSHKYKYRLRPIDVKYALMQGFANFIALSKDDKEIKSRYVRKKKKNSKDIFSDYKIEGYKDIAMIINYGTKKKPRNESIYFVSEKFSNKTIDFYFGVHNSNDTVDLYYKNQKVKTIIIN